MGVIQSQVPFPRRNLAGKNPTFGISDETDEIADGYRQLCSRHNPGSHRQILTIIDCS
jgi:hypothetical protein